ncbi:glutamine synthetase 1 [Oxobacter pfennigii]|uniref:glutamine synthetase n=1 Tax=Oxobacter pfennigii TaxID=36849 RepID=A0A0P8YGT4_9CLOT|nr:glutamine synthetase [Oxobacter pfennigii]KPU46278.1 glutamine synthetase 1 [Oxobacter pfennigii]
MVINTQKSANDTLVYTIKSKDLDKAYLTELLLAHPEIKFVSLFGIDLAGNDTDEKIPICNMLEDMDSFLNGVIQTDGSSVVLPGIATLNNGKVDIIADTTSNWYVDYNYEHIDIETNKPVGTLRIPSFLQHDGQMVDSRSVLKRSVDHFKNTLLELLCSNPDLTERMGFKPDEIDEIVLTSATELEFWVKTPNDKADKEELSASQVLQEQYWKRTKSIVRTSLEQSLLLMDKYGLDAEMGHKEVGGIKSRIDIGGKINHIMEQLEIDWKYSTTLQAADNELMSRIMIKETFRRNGLEVTFMAKPIEGVAGSGEHTHVGVAVKLKSGKRVNLFAAPNKEEDYLSVIGYGALMGFLKHYEVINPFISSTIDSLNRLKPGFEAPVCIVTSLGHSVNIPSRNRTVLVGLVRDMENPLSTRFEVRSPNPHTNTYLALASIYQSMLDGIKAAAASGKTEKELEKEISKPKDTESFYLEYGRAYRSEEDVFEHYSAEERNAMFGTPPATVYDNFKNLSNYPDKLSALTQGGVFNDRIIDSFTKASLLRWTMEICSRIIPEYMHIVRSCRKLHQPDAACDLDVLLWDKAESLRRLIMKDTCDSKSLFTSLREAVSNGDYSGVSRLQSELSLNIDELSKAYSAYKRNLIDIDDAEGTFFN